MTRSKPIQPDTKLTAINPEKIARLKNADLIELHESLHGLYQLGRQLDDPEVCHRAEQMHRCYVHEMLQRSISHPYDDEMDKTVHVTEADEPIDMPNQSQPDSHSDGIMLAFSISPEIAKKIATDDGEPPDELHMTIAYLGKTEDWDAEQLEQLPGIVSIYAANSKPMSGNISGSGRFAASDTSDSQDVLYRSVDLPDLPAWRQGLIDWLEGAGFSRQSEHGYTPHITIKYLQPDEAAEMGTQEIIPVEFDELVCKIGPKVYHFPLAGLHLMKQNTWADKLLASQEKLHESRAGMFSSNNIRSTETSLDGIDLSDVHERNGLLGEEGEESELDREIRNIIKQGLYIKESDITGPIVYGVLLVPDEPDLEGDQFSIDIIKSACEKYSNKLQVDEQHRFANPELEVVDSFIAPDGYTIEGNAVKPGSWVVGIRTEDQDVIDKIRRGDYRGLSIEGSATVRPLKM